MVDGRNLKDKRIQQRTRRNHQSLEKPCILSSIPNGRKIPHNDPKARATFIGMSMDTTREEMTQAVLEGVAFGLA